VTAIVSSVNSTSPRGLGDGRRRRSCDWRGWTRCGYGGWRLRERRSITPLSVRYPVAIRPSRMPDTVPPRQFASGAACLEDGIASPENHTWGRGRIRRQAPTQRTKRSIVWLVARDRVRLEIPAKRTPSPPFPSLPLLLLPPSSRQPLAALRGGQSRGVPTARNFETQALCCSLASRQSRQMQCCQSPRGLPACSSRPSSMESTSRAGLHDLLVTAIVAKPSARLNSRARLVRTLVPSDRRELCTRLFRGCLTSPTKQYSVSADPHCSNDGQASRDVVFSCAPRTAAASTGATNS